jgi:UDP-N-acetylglucosamine 2-epimerase
MKKILTIIGARPQFIKAAPLSKAIKEMPGISEILIHTGQHYDSNMSDIFFREMKIPKPDLDLHVGSGSHAEQTGAIMKGLESAIMEAKPDLVLIYGDTNSTLAGAIAAAKLNIPIAHVEAGLRSFNRAMPEEVNRVVADRLSTLFFCPTQTAVKNLRDEGITRNVFKTGDVMYDATLAFSAIADKKSRSLADLSLEAKSYALVTVHRAENTDNIGRLSNILKALSALALKGAVIFPMHPRTKKGIEKHNLAPLLGKTRVIGPVGFLDMVCLEKNASLIITDSGGVQKEAYFHRVPCVTLRDETEWSETIKAGWNTLADVGEVSKILAAVKRKHRKREIKDYGRGRASEMICKRIMDFFEESHG